MKTGFKTGALVVCLLGILVTLTVYALYLSNAEDKRWEQFKTEHQCVVVARSQGNTSVTAAAGLNSDGSTTTVAPVTTSTPDRTAWLCNDGITYWRND